MSLDVEDMLKTMLGAGKQAFGDGWDAVKNYAPLEFKKIALQVAELAANVALFNADNKQGYSAETGQLLLRMQRNATESVLVAMSALTLLAVQSALDSVLRVLKDAFAELVDVIL
jgi:hypothetical protein